MDVLAEAERICREIAPDLAGAPFYIVDAAKLPWKASPHFGGLTALDLYEVVRPFLDVDRGPGPAIVVANDSLGIALHELAHVGERWCLWDGEESTFLGTIAPPPHKAVRRTRRRVRQVAAAVHLDDAVEYARHVRANYELHSDQWIRCVCHLWWRAKWQGVKVDPHTLGMTGPGRYWPPGYLEPLKIEAFRMRRLPLAQVLKTDASLEFRLRCAGDRRLMEEEASRLDLEVTMSLRETLSKVVSGITGRQQKRLGAYAQLVQDVAGGREPKPDQVDAILLAARKEASDLSRDVELILRKRDLRRIVDAAAGSEAELVQLDRTITTLGHRHDEAIEALLAKYDDAVTPLRAREKELNAMLQGARNAEGELAQLADAELHQFAKVAGQERGAIENELFKLRDTIKDIHYRWAYCERMKKEDPRKEEHFFKDANGAHGVRSPIAEEVAKADGLAAQLEELRSRECKLAAELAKKTQAEADARAQLIAA
jgi:hypothetical protein